MRLTTWILIGLTAVLILYDVWAAANQEAGDTITEVVRAFSREHPLVPFGLGLLVGHFFWYAK